MDMGFMFNKWESKPLALVQKYAVKMQSSGNFNQYCDLHTYNHLKVAAMMKSKMSSSTQFSEIVKHTNQSFVSLFYIWLSPSQRINQFKN